MLKAFLGNAKGQPATISTWIALYMPFCEMRCRSLFKFLVVGPQKSARSFLLNSRWLWMLTPSTVSKTSSITESHQKHATSYVVIDACDALLSHARLTVSLLLKSAKQNFRNKGCMPSQNLCDGGILQLQFESAKLAGCAALTLQASRWRQIVTLPLQVLLGQACVHDSVLYHTNAVPGVLQKQSPRTVRTRMGHPNV